ncbi:hypothetical protein S245_039540 [Arachis hypogaea]
MLLETFLFLLDCGVYFVESRTFLLVSTAFSVCYFLYAVICGQGVASSTDIFHPTFSNYTVDIDRYFQFIFHALFLLLKRLLSGCFELISLLILFIYLFFNCRGLLRNLGE